MHGLGGEACLVYLVFTSKYTSHSLLNLNKYNLQGG